MWALSGVPALKPAPGVAAESGGAAERSLLQRLEGGCQVPVGAYGTVDQGLLSFQALVASLDGSRLVRADIQGQAEDAADLGRRLADRLLSAGGGAILAEVRRGN